MGGKQQAIRFEYLDEEVSAYDLSGPFRKSFGG